MGEVDLPAVSERKRNETYPGLWDIWEKTKRSLPRTERALWRVLIDAWRAGYTFGCDEKKRLEQVEL